MISRLPTPRSAEADALRIVFFGTPRSGKSSLLAAFERIASTEAEMEPVPLKHAQEADPIRRELIPQIVLVDLPDANLVAKAVLLLDCDGEASAKLFNQPGELERTIARGELAVAIHNADALVLIVEARSNEGEIEAHLIAFEEFLKCLRTGRSFDREVGGWPIFLTLTKCDKLFEPGMSTQIWLERVEREKETLEAQFVERFEELIEKPGDVFSFGSVQLSMEATSANLPDALRDPAYNLENGTHNLDSYVPKVLLAAGEFRSRTRAARRRLKWTASGVVALLASMVLLMLGLFVAGEASPLEKLASRVQTLQTQNEPAALRLSEKNIDKRKNELELIRDSQDFPRLPVGLQQFVQSRLQEIEAYRVYKSEFAAPQFAPADVRTFGMYQRLQHELETKLAPPPEQAQLWNETEAVRLRQKWRDDLRLLGEYEDRVHSWYRQLIVEATDLMVNSQQPGWRQQIDRIVREAGQPTFSPPGTALQNSAPLPLPGSQRLLITRGEPLTFGDVYRYERADFAKRDWELSERRLLDLRDLTDAVGLTVNPDEPTAVLILPEPSANLNDSRLLAGQRLDTLNKQFPRAAEGRAYWQTTLYPEPLQQELSRRLRLAAETGLRHVRLLLDNELKLGNGRVDTPADWHRLVDSPKCLLLQSELRSWGRFLQLLLSWSDPTRGEADPVAELTEFLKADQFTLPISAVEVSVPNSLRVQIFTPDGVLLLTSGSRTLRLKLSDEVKSDANGSTYRFVPAIPLTPLEYRPGESFTAELPLKAGTSKYVLRWTRSRTTTFAVEKLFLDPDLERLQPAEKPQRTTGIRVKILPEKPGGLIPELLPTLTGVN